MLDLQAIVHKASRSGHSYARCIGLSDLLKSKGPRAWMEPPAEILEREKHASKVIVIRGDVISCVLVGALIAGRLPAYGRSILRFLRDLREYRNGN